MTKDDIRKEMRRLRSGLDPDWIARTSELVQRRVLEIDEFKQAAVVSCYLADIGEVHMNLIMETCWKAGKKVLVPAYWAAREEYRWACLERNDRLRIGPWGIPEPEKAAIASGADVDMVIVPGVAFDEQGNRLGHGCGYYDRLLSGFREGPAFKLGIAFAYQVVESLPALPHDVIMDAVATERGLFRRPRPAHSQSAARRVHRGVKAKRKR